jgi:hypothetical protein
MQLQIDLNAEHMPNVGFYLEIEMYCVAGVTRRQ